MTGTPVPHRRRVTDAEAAVHRDQFGKTEQLRSQLAAAERKNRSLLRDLELAEKQARFLDLELRRAKQKIAEMEVLVASLGGAAK